MPAKRKVYSKYTDNLLCGLSYMKRKLTRINFWVKRKTRGRENEIIIHVCHIVRNMLIIFNQLAVIW